LQEKNPFGDYMKPCESPLKNCLLRVRKRGGEAICGEKGRTYGGKITISSSKAMQGMKGNGSKRWLGVSRRPEKRGQKGKHTMLSSWGASVTRRGWNCCRPGDRTESEDDTEELWYSDSQETWKYRGNVRRSWGKNLKSEKMTKKKGVFGGDISYQMQVWLD